MKRSWPLAVVTLLAFTACADSGDTAGDGVTVDTMGVADPDLGADGAATALPAGYAVRHDQPDADASAFQVTEEDGALRVRTGPAGILYREADAVADGDYTVSATFTEIGAPADHREGFGLIVGGSDLNGPAQRYTYFLVRADGSYLIKRRDGENTPDVSPNGWNPSDAVTGAAEAGDITNTLSIQVHGDQVHFLVNGTEVAAHPAADIDAHGVAGVRINHNLDVRVEGFEVTGG